MHIRTKISKINQAKNTLKDDLLAFNTKAAKKRQSIDKFVAFGGEQARSRKSTFFFNRDCWNVQ